MKAQFNIGSSPEETYRGGMEYYSTMLHEMTHSTMTPERLNRETGGRFATRSTPRRSWWPNSRLHDQPLHGFDSKVTDNSAAYLDSWIAR